MTHYVSTFRTPEGPFSVAVDAAGAVLATVFGPPAALRPHLRGGRIVPDRRAARHVREQVDAWFAGRRTRFELALAPAAATAFRRRVWDALSRIPFGTTTTYGALAHELGTSPRAVGGANAANPLCLLVPCHRVIGADGTLTGFAYGTDRKRRLLAREARRRISRAATA